MQPRRTPSIVAAMVMALYGCSKEDAKPQELTGALAAQTQQQQGAAQDEPAAALQQSGEEAMPLAEQVGVEPGAFAIDPGAGPEAIVVEREGELRLRRAGEEGFSEVAPEASIELRVGDQIETGQGARARLMLADGSAAELAEHSAIAIGDRDGDADPMTSVAVLVGIVRFEVTRRAPGEGPFLVFTPSGIANALGTTFVVGVAATGSVNVGVEEGSVEVSGSADLTRGASLEGGKAVSLDIEGKLATVAELDAQWGAWRAQAEAEVQPAAAIDAQLDSAEAAEAEIEQGYDTLAQLAAQAEQAAAEAESMQAQKDLEAYQAGAEKRAGMVEAPFAASLRLQQLSFALLGRAYVAQQIYLRNPQALAAAYVPRRALAAKAVLYQKKYHVASRARLRPLRSGYHRHHPRGRGQAKAMGVEVPAFFLEAKLSAVEEVEPEQMSTYRPRRPGKVDKRRRIEPNGPARGWHEKARPARRATKAVAWYRAPEKGDASPLLRGKPRRASKPMLVSAPPRPRDQVSLSWGKQRPHPGRGLAKGHSKQAAAKAPPAEPAAPQPPAVNPAGKTLPPQAAAHGNRTPAPGEGEAKRERVKGAKSRPAAAPAAHGKANGPGLGAPGAAKKAKPSEQAPGNGKAKGQAKGRGDQS